MKYFHITQPERVETIKKEGIQSNDEGDIYLIIEKGKTNLIGWNSIFDLVAAHQLGMDEYILITIDGSGVTGDLILDNVGEYTSPYQRVLKQPRIDPEYLLEFELKSVDLDDE